MMQMAVNVKVFVRFYVLNVYSQGIRFRFTFSIMRILSCQLIRKHRSSWLDQEQVLRRSAPLCRSVKRSEPKENHGCSSVISILVTDFLYQTEWQKWLKNGVLTKMDVAFSRDTDEKVYVQHRMLEHSKELFEWLQEGAAVYICGDEKHMAHDVHQHIP